MGNGWSLMPERAKEEHIYMMKHPNSWPIWPVLPLIKANNTSGGFPKAGCLIEFGMSGPEPIVWLKMMWELPQKATESYMFENIEHEKFDSFEDIVAAGWIVD